MQPTLKFTVNPLPDSEWAEVTLTAYVIGEFDTEVEVTLYHQWRLVQPLDEHISLELWACGAFGDTANATTAALMELVRTGSITLMADVAKQKKY